MGVKRRRPLPAGFVSNDRSIHQWADAQPRQADPVRADGLQTRQQPRHRLTAPEGKKAQDFTTAATASLGQQPQFRHQSQQETVQHLLQQRRADTVAQHLDILDPQDQRKPDLAPCRPLAPDKPCQP